MTAAEKRIRIQNMIEDIPYRDNIEGTWWPLRSLQFRAFDISQAKLLPCIPHRRGRDLATVALPARTARHQLQEKTKPASHVQKASGPTGYESVEEILVHSRSGLLPVEMVAVVNLIAPEVFIMRLARVRREDVAALIAPQNIDSEFSENRSMLHASTKEACLSHCRLCA
jgi:hypothetical protein